MTKLDEIIFSYTYARVAGTRIPRNLEQKAKEILLSAPKDIQNTMFRKCFAMFRNIFTIV